MVILHIYTAQASFVDYLSYCVIASIYVLPVLNSGNQINGCIVTGVSVKITPRRLKKILRLRAILVAGMLRHSLLLLGLRREISFMHRLAVRYEIHHYHTNQIIAIT